MITDNFYYFECFGDYFKNGQLIVGQLFWLKIHKDLFIIDPDINLYKFQVIITVLNDYFIQDIQRITKKDFLIENENSIECSTILYAGAGKMNYKELRKQYLRKVYSFESLIYFEMMLKKKNLPIKILIDQQNTVKKIENLLYRYDSRTDY